MVFAMLARYLRLWLQSYASSAGIGLFDLVAMSFKKVSPTVIVRSKIMAVQAGLGDASGITKQALEAHYLAGGRVPLVVIDHVTSNSAVVLPVAALVRECRRVGALCVVDGAHGLGGLSTILDESLAHLSKIAAPLRSFDFFSLDTEGTEDVVLESLLGGGTAAFGDANRDQANGGADATGTADAVSDGDANGTGAWWLPKVVLVEAVGPVTKDNSVDKMLKAANYTRRHALELKTVDKRKTRGPGIVRNRVYTRLNSAEELRCAKLLKGGGRST
jgi:hypothetical protein